VDPLYVAARHVLLDALEALSGQLPAVILVGAHAVYCADVRDEMVAAPRAVRRFFDEMLGFAEVADITGSALDLRDAYLQARIVTPKYSDDAFHVALATVAGCTLIVSWNFQQIAIFSPQEVIQYEDEEV
jgi:hypothetical protein